MRTWDIKVQSEPYTVGEHERGAFANVTARLEAGLNGSDVLAVVAESPGDGLYAARFSVRARTAGEAADRGCEVFVRALDEALQPLRFPVETEHGGAPEVEGPIVASVTAEARLDSATTRAGGHYGNEAAGAPDGADVAGVEINGYVVPADVCRPLVEHLRAIQGDWNGPAAKSAMQIDMMLQGGGERGLRIDGPEREAICDALQNWIGEMERDTDAEHLIALMQGLAREAVEPHPV